MILKGKTTINYRLSGEKKHHEIKVQLKQVDSHLKKNQNIYEGFALVDDINYNHPDLKNCVNAQYMAESIANDLINKLREKHDKNFRLKHNKKKK